MFLLPIVRIADLIIEVLTLAILASVIISWLRLFNVRVPYYHPVVQVIEQTADLLLRPIRRAMPTAAGGIDFSPMVALIILQVARALLYRLV